MNYDYLIQYISQHLHTFVRIFGLDYKLSKSFCGQLNFQDELFDADIPNYFTVFSALFSAPVLLSVGEQIIYALIPADKQYIVIGPVRFHTPIQLKHCANLLSIDSRWLETVPYCEFGDFTTDALLVYNLTHPDILSKDDLLLANCVDLTKEHETLKCFSDLVFQNREYKKSHNPYDQELREFSSIEHGNLEQLRRSLEEDYPGEIGTLASNPLRQTKNRAIVVITLACRSAIRGGLSAEIAFSLSDSYIQKIEECDDIPTLFHLFHSAEFYYAQLVKNLNEQKAGEQLKDPSPHINKCKNYIYAHLHEKIYMKDIADKLDLNPNYLSTLFHDCEKISVTDFILREKINLAQNLLIYSDYTFIEIASYLNFSSQSHLGKLFKQSTGYTLKKYREKYGVEDFLK